MIFNRSDSDVAARLTLSGLLAKTFPNSAGEGKKCSTRSKDLILRHKALPGSPQQTFGSILGGPCVEAAFLLYRLPSSPHWRYRGHGAGMQAVEHRVNSSLYPKKVLLRMTAVFLRRRVAVRERAVQDSALCCAAGAGVEEAGAHQEGIRGNCLVAS